MRAIRINRCTLCVWLLVCRALWIRYQGIWNWDVGNVAAKSNGPRHTRLDYQKSTRQSKSSGGLHEWGRRCKKGVRQIIPSCWSRCRTQLRRTGTGLDGVPRDRYGTTTPKLCVGSSPGGLSVVPIVVSVSHPPLQSNVRLGQDWLGVLGHTQKHIATLFAQDYNHVKS